MNFRTPMLLLTLALGFPCFLSADDSYRPSTKAQKQATPNGRIYSSPAPPVAGNGYSSPGYTSNPYGNSAQGREAHIQQAISHLRAAGKSDLADKIHKEFVQEGKERELKQKLEQLEWLQKEIDQLRKETGMQQTVMLHVKILELHVDKMRQLGLDFETPAGKSALDENINQVTMDKSFQQMLEALRQNGLVKVLAEPTLVTLSGRPATVQTGGEIPVAVPQESGKVAVEFRQFGTKIDCVPVVVGNNRIRLEMRPSLTELDPAQSVKVNGVDVPGLRTRHVDTAVEIKVGETMVLGGLTSERKVEGKKGQKTAMLMTVTAELVDGVPATKQR